MSVQAGLGIRTEYATSNVGLVNWVILIASLPAVMTSFSIFDSSGRTLEIGVCAADASPNAEVRQFLLPPGGAAGRIQIPAGQRLSIRAVSAAATSGENDTNVFF